MKRLGIYDGVVRLLALTVILPVVIYCGVINKTVTLLSDYRQNGAEIELLEADLRSVPDSTTQPEVPPEARLLSSGSIIDRMIDEFARTETIVEQYTPYFASTDTGAKVYIGEIVISGRFIPLLRIIKYAEEHPEFGTLVSACFETTRASAIQESRLKMTLIIKQIEI